MIGDTGAAPSHPFPGPKPAGWIDPFDKRNQIQRRGPLSAISTGTKPRPDPWPLDFCIWLGSEEFGNNRRYILKSVGSTWLGDDATINEGISEWLNSLQQRVTRSPKESSPGLTEATR